MEDNNMETKEVKKVETESTEELAEQFVGAIKDGVDMAYKEGLKDGKKKRWNPVTWFNGLKLWQKIALGAVAGTTLLVGGYKLHIKLHHGKLIAEAVADNADKVVETVAEVAPEVTETVVETVSDVAEEVVPF